MATIPQRMARHRGTVLLAALRVLLYTGITVLFYVFMTINNWQLRNISRTTATVTLTWVAMCIAMLNIYGGFAVGQKKNKPIISAVSLSAIITDLVTYLQLQIMNVNENNNARLMFFGNDFPWLLVCMECQILFITLMTHVGNRVFFHFHPPQRCLLIVGEMIHRPAMETKIARYALQWQIVDTALYTAPDLHARIQRVDTVFLASDLPEDCRMALLRQCYDLKKDVHCKAQIQDIMLSNARQVIVDDAPFLEMPYYRMSLGQRILKRCMDIGLSAVVLVVLSPLMGLIALSIRLEDGGKVIFRQERKTINGRIFRICKFRTMRESASNRKHQVSAKAGDRRITRVGRVLRRTRLDELPQFWNILRGDMTLVGPRPEMLENVEKYKAALPEFVYREKMKAGLTGYAQIEGRYNTTPEDKLMLDLMYIEGFSLWGDVKLLFRTFTVFFKADSTEGFDTPTEEDNEDGRIES